MKTICRTESVQAAPASLKAATVQHEEQESEQDRLQAQAREENVYQSDCDVKCR